MSHRQVWSWWWQLQQWWLSSSFLSVTCCGEAFRSLGVQAVEGLILGGALFLLDEGGEEKERKKIAMGKEGFPGTRSALLAV
jgi:hypothetical protein